MTTVSTAKLFVRKEGSVIGMDKDTRDFGTFVPNMLGDNRATVLTFKVDGANTIMKMIEKIDGVDDVKITTEAGVVEDLAWDAATSSYKAASTKLKATMESHYDGVLNLVVSTGVVVPPLAKPNAPAAPTFASIAQTTATVNWTAATGGAVANYKVHVKAGTTDISGSPFTMASTTLTKKLTGLTAATAYTVTIEAINASGSATSPAATLTTLAVIKAPASTK